MVGLKLFIRHGRGVQINEEGRLYALQVREALHHIADATRLVQVNPRRQELTLAMVPSFGCHWLLPRLERFREKYPHISLRIQASLAITSMQQEGADLAIRMGKGERRAITFSPISLSLWPRQPITVACSPVRRQR